MSCTKVRENNVAAIKDWPKCRIRASRCNKQKPAHPGWRKISFQATYQELFWTSCPLKYQTEERECSLPADLTLCCTAVTMGLSGPSYLKMCNKKHSSITDWCEVLSTCGNGGNMKMGALPVRCRMIPSSAPVVRFLHNRKAFNRLLYNFLMLWEFLFFFEEQNVPVTAKAAESGKEQ